MYIYVVYTVIKGESIECVKKGTFCMQFNFLNGRVREGQPGQWSGNSIPVPSQIEAARSRHGITNCRDQKKKYFVVTQHFSGIGTHSASVISKSPQEKKETLPLNLFILTFNGKRIGNRILVKKMRDVSNRRACKLTKTRSNYRGLGHFFPFPFSFSLSRFTCIESGKLRNAVNRKMTKQFSLALIMNENKLGRQVCVYILLICAGCVIIR